MTTNGTEERPLPDGWMWTRLRELAVSPKDDIVDGPFGSNLKASEYVDSGIPIIRLQNIDRDRFINKNIRFVTQEKADSLSRHSFLKGDIVITKLGDPLGKACLVPDYLDNGIIVADVVRARVDESNVDKKYLIHCINSEIVIEQLAQKTKGTTRPRVNLGHIRNIDIPLAPFSEQKRIVAEIEKQFTRLDQAVASLKRLQGNLARYKASVLKAACEGRLVPQDETDEPASELLARILAERRAQWEAQEWQNLIVKARKKAAQAQRKAQGLPARIKDLQPGEWEAISETDYARYLPKNDKWKEKYKEPVGVDTAVLPDLPEGWIKVPLDKLILDIQTGPFGSSLHKSDYVEDGIPVINPASIIDRKIIPIEGMSIDEETRERLNNFILRDGDIIMGRRGEMGRSAAITEREDGWLCGTGSLILKFASQISRQFIVYMFSSEPVKAYLGNASVGTTMQNLNQKILLNMPVGLPPEAEQNRIVAEVERRLSVVTASEQALTTNLARAERLRQSILHRAFTGRLVRPPIKETT